MRVVPLPDYRGPWAFLGARRALVRTLSAAIAEADVLCLRAPGPIAGLAWKLRCGRPFGVEVVGDPSDALAPGAVASAVRPLARAVLARELRAMCSRAAAVAYVTRATLPERYPTGGWSTAYSSIDLGAEAFASEAESARRAAEATARISGSSRRRSRLVFVGSLAQLYKGPHLLIDAVARCRARGLDVELTLVGDGAHGASLIVRAAAHGLADHVRFAGPPPPCSAVRNHLDRADLLVFALKERRTAAGADRGDGARRARARHPRRRHPASCCRRSAWCRAATSPRLPTRSRDWC